MSTCPTCGQIVDPHREATRLLAILTDGAPHRQVYRAANGSGWYVTRGGGHFSASAVEALVSQGLIQSVYNNCPRDAYHVGKTLDYEATLAERKNHRHAKDAPLVYTDGSREFRAPH